MIDGASQNESFTPAGDDAAALGAAPALIAAVRALVEARAPRVGPAGLWRATLIGGLLASEIAAEMLAAAMPEAVRAVVREGRAVAEPARPAPDEPRVPRWSGHDARLPPGSPHP